MAMRENFAIIETRSTQLIAHCFQCAAFIHMEERKLIKMKFKLISRSFNELCCKVISCELLFFCASRYRCATDRHLFFTVHWIYSAIPIAFC